MTRRRDPTSIAAAIGDLTAAVMPDTALARLQLLWPEVVGDVVAAWTEPVAERDGKVTVACRDSVVAQELDLQRAEFLARLVATQPRVGCVIHELRFISR